MEATVSYTVDIPEADSGLLETMAKRFGWKASKEEDAYRPSPQLLQAIKEVEEGKNLYRFDNVEEALKWLHED